MVRLVVLAAFLFLTGCESLQQGTLFEERGGLWGSENSNSGTSAPDIEQPSAPSEVDALFAQPYIDPLTRYLNRFADENTQPPRLPEVRRERDLRCAIISERFNRRALTPETLASYRVGYAFSCPDDVARYGQHLADQQSQAIERATTETPVAVSPRLPKELNDCYLLTRIRNFSDALRACRGPAEDGNRRAQVNMALISHSLEDYSQAQQWAREAAPDSPEAAFLLGQMYLSGQGVERDNESAQRWFAQAAQQGHSDAKAMLQRAEGRDAEMSITNR